MKILKIILLGLGIVLILLALVPLLIPVDTIGSVEDPQQLADAGSQFAEINGITVHYKKLGSGGPVTILLHGFGASVFSWREVIPALGQNGTVIAYDRPAFGLTERPMEGDWQGESPYGLDAQVKLLIGLMDYLEVDKATLVGNSAGGTIAALTALQYPQRVQALILVDAAIYAGGGSPAWLKPLFSTPQIRHIGPLIARRLMTGGDKFLQTAWHDPSKITTQIYTGYHNPLQIKNWDKALWQLTLASGDSGLVDQLDKLTLPVLVVSGDDDRIVPTEQSVRLGKEIPHASLVLFKDCGHLPQEECPQQFLQAVQPFIDQFR